MEIIKKAIRFQDGENVRCMILDLQLIQQDARKLSRTLDVTPLDLNRYSSRLAIFKTMALRKRQFTIRFRTLLRVLGKGKWMHEFSYMRVASNL